jgi:DNA-binding NarL/FixJ family response regulator/glutaredoxin-related protein
MMEIKTGIEIELKERIKELNCLYEMTRMAEKYHDSMRDFLKNLVEFIPQSWKYAEIACASIVFQNETYKSKNFKWSEWRQSSQIIVNDELMGDVTIIYSEERPEEDEGPFLKEERKLLDSIAQRIGDTYVRIMAQQELQENNMQLLIERKSLQETNAALRIVLSNIEDEKKRIYENIRLNIDKVIMPVIHALMPAVPRSSQKYVEILSKNLEEITSPFISGHVQLFRALTPTEVNICNMVRNGLRTKEIAQMRGVSEATINRHREHIRRKLKITNQQINLTTYLQSVLSTEKSLLPEKK